MIELISNSLEDNNSPIYMKLYNKIAHEIKEGNIKADEKLPSIRKLSKELGISRTTIENAYNQLLMEGYVYSKPQSGYYVSYLDGDVFIKDFKKNNYSNNEELSTKKDKFVDKALFNFAIWKKNINRTINDYEDDLYSKVDNQGELMLRQEITRYIYKYRGVDCIPEQVIIGAGVQILLNVLCHLLKINGYNEAAFENPGFKESHHIFTNSNFNINHIPVKDDGIDIDKLKESKSEVCYLSPSHQFPTGAIMPVYKRIELIKWAREGKNIIIEDDYDSELIYSGKPIPSLQGMDGGNNVIYLGSFSTLFLPVVRVSYMVIPKDLLNSYKEIKNMYNSTVSKLEQLSLAHFMNTGEFEKHIRRVKNHLAKKNKVLINEIQKRFTNKLIITSGDIGVYLILRVLDKQKLPSLISGCKKNDIPLKSLSDYMINKETKEYDNIVILMYRDIPMERLEEVLDEMEEWLK